MSEPVFLLGLAIAGTTVVLVVGIIARAIGGGSWRSGLAHLSERLDRHAAALDEAQNSLANQATQLAELQERLDFAERVLARGPDRTALGPGEQGG